MEIRLADLILVKGTNWISHFIEDVEKSPYSHVAIYMGNDQLIEAQGFKRTGFVPLSTYKGMTDIYTCDEATDKQRQKIVDYLTKEVGTHYSYLLFAWEFVRYETGILLPYDPGPNRICSYLATEAYAKNVLNLCPGIRFPSPADVAQSKLLRKIGSL